MLYIVKAVSHSIFLSCVSDFSMFPTFFYHYLEYTEMHRNSYLQRNKLNRKIPSENACL